MSGNTISAKSNAERDAVQMYIIEKVLTSSNSDAPGRVNFSALGINFTSIFVGGGGEGAAASAGASAWSATGKVDELTKALRALDIHLLAEKMDLGRGQLESVLTATKITTDQKQQLIVAKGEVFMDKGPSLNGVTFACAFSSPTDAEVQGATGLPSAKSILQRIALGEKIPKNVIDQVIQRGGPNAVGSLAEYQWLDAEQVVALLANNIPWERQRLLNNKSATLSTQQIDQIIHTSPERALLSLIASRYDELTPTQREELAQRPSTAPYMTVRAGNGAAS